MEYKIGQIKETLKYCALLVSDQKEQLEKIDSQVGDGDLGISMRKGATAVVEEIDRYGGNDPGALFMKCAMALNKAAPSTMGTLLCAGLMQMGKVFAKKEVLKEAEIAEIPSLFAQAIMDRGRAKKGDRTVLDALLPMAEAIKAAFDAGRSLAEAIAVGAEAARSGMEKTKEMVPKVGRSKWAPENTKNVPDGGAVLCWIVAQGLAERSEQKK
ncbi:MAG: dihydroxyacetone kinase subunit L [Synergistaceae bacterium]|nr:dihydroxyacetone kinase subunit L [Synergistaceae bacterium]